MVHASVHTATDDPDRTVIVPGRALMDGGYAMVARHGRPPEANQDAVLCEPRVGLFAVFDGIGGHAGGREAACVARDAVAACLLRLSPMERADPTIARGFVRAAVIAAHLRILHAAEGRSALRGMGATCAVAYVLRDPATGLPREAVVAHVGDSRAIHYRNGTRIAGTTDHSGLQAMIAAGTLPPRADQIGDPEVDRVLAAQTGHLPAFVLTHRNQVVRFIGQTTRDGAPAALAVDAESRPLASGDVLALTTDGVHDNLLDGELDAIAYARRGSTAADHANALVYAAITRAESDHIRAVQDDMSAVVARILAAAQ